MAKHARRLLNLVDDTPIVPGDAHPAFNGVEAARQVLNDAEADLRDYELHVEPIASQAGNLGVGAMPSSANSASVASQPAAIEQPTSDAAEVQSQPLYSATEAEQVEREQPVQREVSTAV